jgi:nitric oxide reductase NorQ protein
MAYNGVFGDVDGPARPHKERLMDPEEIMDSFRLDTRPNYIPQGNEEELFTHAFRQRVPLILKGPTGCGKTRFVEHMASHLDLPLVTVSCHEDLTAADLVGRFLFKGNETVWQDGPLTLAVRYGAICYLDEIVEARKDTTVIIHSLTDDRRMLFIDQTGEVLRAHADFMMVLSYNPGYQNVVKDLKQSTKQRFASLQFGYPPADTETRIVVSETGVEEETARQLAEMAGEIRQLKGFGLEEGASTRLLVYAGRLIQDGMDPLTACTTSISNVLSDDPEMIESLQDIVNAHFGDVMAHEAAEDEQ